MIVIRKKSFTKSFDRLPVRLRDKVILALSVFEADPFDPRLRNHALRGRFADLRSVDVTGDVRVLFREFDGAYELVELVDVGTHSKLYG